MLLLLIQTVDCVAQITKDSVLNLLKYISNNESNFNKMYPLSKKALQYAINLKDTLLIIQSYQKTGDVLWYGSIYGNAEEYYFKSLEIADSSKYPREYAYALYGIGWIECIQKGKKEKISLLNRALKIYSILKDSAYIVTLANALSGAYLEFYNQDTSSKYYIDSAISILSSAIELLKKSERWKFRLSGMEANLAKEFYLKKDYINAYKHISAALSNPNIHKFRRNFLSAILIKSAVLNKISLKDSSRYLIKKYYNEIEKLDDNEILEDFYFLLYEQNKEDKNFQKALFYLEKYVDKKNIINKELLSVKFEELEANKELFKKEQSLIALQKENEISQLKNKQKTYFLFLAFLFILLITFFLLKTLKQNNKIKKLNSEVTAQKLLLEQKNKDITDSINYASRIQRALITSDEFIHNHFIKEGYIKDFFVLYMPKDIVSGDFYWANVNVQREDMPHYLAVCDCTGHGVPGAFMSLLNINYLTEAVQERQIYYPDEVLNYVRDKLITNLSYDEQQKDGMDATIVMMNKDFVSSRKLYYSLANHQMVLMRDGEQIILSGDKMPVGKGYYEDKFKLYELDVREGDWLYMYTDGYKDQFGGEKGKRIMQKRFIEILKEISRKSSQEQREYLYQYFTEWKQNHEQTDDVCVVGMKV